MFGTIETVAAAIVAVILGGLYVVEKLEKRGMVKMLGSGREPPEWAERQNKVLVLIAENMENMDEDATAKYLGVEREPGLDDVVVEAD